MKLSCENLSQKIVIAALGLAGAILLILITNGNGAGISPDSVAYISAARNLAEGNGLLTYNSLHLVVQPPLYPLLLAVIKKIFLIDPLLSAGYVNALLFGFIVFLSGLLLLRYLKSFVLVLLGTVSVLTSYALAYASLMALSELLFISLLLLFLYLFGTYQKKMDIRSLILFSAVAALSCLTRYTGVVVILTGLVCIFMWNKNDVKEKIVHYFIFMIIAVVPIAIWIIRNYLISGTLVGLRASSSYTLVDNIRFFFHTVMPWFFPSALPGVYFVLILSILAAMYFYGLGKVRASLKESVKEIGPSLFFVVVYSGVIVISSTTTAYDRISDRLLSPVFIPMVLISFFFLDKIYSLLLKFFNAKLMMAFFILGLLLMIRYPFQNTIAVVEEYKGLSGLGYSGEIWKKSATINYFYGQEQLMKNYTLYSNEPEAVYILTNLTTKRSPAKTFYNSPQLLNSSPKEMEVFLNEKNVCLIWFDKANRKFLFTLDELQKNINMAEVAHLQDGRIYTYSVK